MQKIALSLTLLLLLSACNTPNTVNTTGTTVSSETRTVQTPTQGSGKHTIEMFTDFQCPACINFSKAIAPIIEWYADKGLILIKYRQFPLVQIHKNAYRDSMAALCGAEQGKYIEYKTALYAMEESKAWATVSDTDRVNAGKAAWLDAASLETCLSSNRYQAQVDSDMALGESLNVNSTPTLMLDGKKLDLSVFRDTEMFTKFLDGVVSE